MSINDDAGSVFTSEHHSSIRSSKSRGIESIEADNDDKSSDRSQNSADEGI